MREKVYTESAPPPVGPYSQAVRTGNLLFVSGQLPLHPQSGEVVGQDVQTQTRQVLSNLVAILEASGATVNDVAKTTVYIQNMDHFPDVNRIYAETFGESAPARVCVEVSRLPRNVLVEIDALALVGGGR